MGKRENVQMGRWQKTIFLSFLIVFAAQININLFITNFKISIAVIFIPVFLFLLEDIALIPITFLSALGVFGSRVLLYWFQNGAIPSVYQTYLPELFFYITYGILLFIYDRHMRHHLDKNSLFIPLFFMDYFSNLTELLCRLYTDAFQTKAQLSILLVALVRTILIWIILTALDRYRLTLLSKEHAQRYQRLMLLISKLNGEVLWMQKNTALIEDTMSTSYALFHKLQKEEVNPALAASALSVAKDIHEIKKEYYLIMRGLSDAMHKEFQDNGMAIAELLQLLEKSALADAEAMDKKLTITIQCDRSLYTDKHYLFMSVFHNLFSNALEASDKTEPHIQVIQTERGEHYVFQVIDNGPGVEEEYAAQVFDAGFSTKIDYTTGTINRGLGLNIVKGIVETEFDGTISLTSIPGHTEFIISIPKNNLEVTQL